MLVLGDLLSRAGGSARGGRCRTGRVLLLCGIALKTHPSHLRSDKHSNLRLRRVSASQPWARVQISNAGLLSNSVRRCETESTN